MKPRTKAHKLAIKRGIIRNTQEGTQPDQEFVDKVMNEWDKYGLDSDNIDILNSAIIKAQSR